MSDSELPRTDWLDLAVMSKASKDYLDEWGTILDEENFERLDRETMISGSYVDRPEQAPHAGAKYHAVDLNAVFTWDAEADEWVVLNSGTSTDPVPGPAHLESIRTDETWTKAEVGGAPKSRLQPLEDALREGYPVGITNGAQVVVDPTDYADDAAALQAINDTLQAKSDTDVQLGWVHIPARKPDGTEWLIGSTVTFGDRTAEWGALPKGWGFSGSDNPMIQCSIDDGSPMFEVVFDTENDGSLSANNGWFGGFTVDGGTNDAECIRLESVQSFDMRDIYARDFETVSAEGVFVLSGRCYNSYIEGCHYSQYNSVAHCDVWRMVDDGGDEETGTGERMPGEITWGPNNSSWSSTQIDGQISTVYRQDVPCSTMHFGGRVEGAAGDASIHVTAGEIFLPSTFEAGAVRSETTSSIYFDGYRLQIAPGASFGSPPDSVPMIDCGPNASRVSIPSLQTDHSGTNTVLRVEDGGGSKRIVVPYPSTFNGTVDYPSAPWSNTYYSDGWQLVGSGSVTVDASSGDGSGTVSAFVDPATYDYDLHTWMDASEGPGETVIWDESREWDSANARNEINLRDVGGADTDYRVRYELRRRAL